MLAGELGDDVIHLPLLEPVRVDGQSYSHVAVRAETLKYIKIGDAGNRDNCARKTDCEVIYGDYLLFIC